MDLNDSYYLDNMDLDNNIYLTVIANDSYYLGNNIDLTAIAN